MKKIALVVAMAALSTNAMAANPVTDFFSKLHHSIQDQFREKKDMVERTGPLGEEETAEDRVKWNYMSDKVQKDFIDNAIADLEEEIADTRVQEYSKMEELRANLKRLKEEKASQVEFNPHMQLAEIYLTEVDLNNPKGIESAERLVDFVKSDEEVTLVTVDEEEVVLKWVELKPFLEEPQALEILNPHKLIKYTAILKANGMYEYDKEIQTSFGTVFQDHDLYDMQRMDLKTGLESHELLGMGKSAIASDTTDIVLCGFYTGTDKFYEVTLGSLNEYIGVLNEDQAFCIDKELPSYLKQRKNDFFGVIGHMVEPK